MLVRSLVSAANFAARLAGFTLLFTAVPILTLELPAAAQNQVRFAVIGDYGDGSTRERDVANRVKSWNPDLVITTGDNNYPDGASSTIDPNIGQFYQQFIYPYRGSYGPGAPNGINRFFPTLGNHDWHAAGARPYLDYFTLPGKERYYDFVWGPVHFFAIDSDTDEPDGTGSSSVQAIWLRDRLAASTARWKIVYFHHPPYSSGNHGSSTYMRWPFQSWGATAVLAGHDHTYERLSINGFPYFVNGLGGRSIYSFGTPISGSQFRYNADYGAQLVEATDSSITFRFYNRAGTLIDTHTISGGTTLPSAPTELAATAVSSSRIDLTWRDTSSNENGFYVERSLSASSFTQVATLGPNTSTYSNTGLAGGTTYNYRVRAFNDAGASAYSNTDSATTPSGSGTTTTVAAAADAYVQDGNSANTNFGTSDYLLAKTSASGYNRDSYLKFSLSGVSSISIARLRVFGELDRSGSLELTAYGTGTTSWTESGLTWNTRPALGTGLDTRAVTGTSPAWYEFDVTAFVNAELSAGRTVVSLALHSPVEASAMVRMSSREGANAPNLVITTSGSATAPNAPSNLTASAASSTQVVLSWADASDNEDGFRIERASGGSAYTEIGTVGRNVTGFTDSNLAAGTTYAYRVRAYSAAGLSAYSNLATATTPPLNGGGTTTLTAAADAFVQDGASASSNFGSLSYLLMKNSAPGYNRETFVKFDLSGMGTVSQARIRVFAAADRSETVNLGVHGAAGAAWTEGGITWNSRPPTGASLGSTSVNGTTSQWHEIDVTSFVVAEKQAGRSVVTLVLRVPAESAAMIKAESREGSSGPELVVTHN